MNGIVGVLVLYYPNIELIKKVLESLLSQVDSIIAVDNSKTNNNHLFTSFEDKVIYIPLHRNIGIASAQNIAIERAKEFNFKYVFLLDQDSIVEQDMTSRLASCYENLIGNGIKVGAVGPRPINRENGKEYRGKVRPGRQLSDGITEVTELISSASLIPIENFNVIGRMEDELFIDGVDHEWCWRGRKVGYRFFIDEDTHLSHKLGEGDRYFLFRKVAIPTPFRTYYQFRNYFKLLKRSYVPIYWKCSNGFKYLIKMFYFPLFVAPRRAYMNNIFRGIKDGISSLLK